MLSGPDDPQHLTDSRFLAMVRDEEVTVVTDCDRRRRAQASIHDRAARAVAGDADERPGGVAGRQRVLRDLEHEDATDGALGEHGEDRDRARVGDR
jgi:hypothetical protein